MIRLLVRGAHEGRVDLDADAHHYLSRVLRLEAGDSLEVFDGAGQRFVARVAETGEQRSVLELSAPARESPLREITVVQGLPKGDKLELVLQKGTELGASAFAPVACERSVVKLEGKAEARLARWTRIVEEAARQCQRSSVPEVLPTEGLVARVASLTPRCTVLVLDEEERARPLSELVRAHGDRPLALVIGPEGGLSRNELDQLLRLGAVPVTLGRLVLRTETAALAALTVIRHLDGALG